MHKSIKNILGPPYKLCKAVIGDYKLKKYLNYIRRNKKACKVVVGSAGFYQPGWAPTDIEYFDILRIADWERYFSKSSIDAILAEHVWEHLTEKEGIIAARMCFDYLKPLGYLRVAVPDGLHPDPHYIEAVKPGGMQGEALHHRVLYTYGKFKELFQLSGFNVKLLEYFDEKGLFHYQDWDQRDGLIRRSKNFDKRNRAGSLAYTSIVLDACKER